MSRRDGPRAYTLLSDPVVGENGEVVGGAFGGTTREIPVVAREVTVSEVGAGRIRLWWLPQDLALGGGMVLSVLRAATVLRLVPILSRKSVSGVDGIISVTAFQVSVPSYVNDSPERDAQIGAVRAAIAELASGSTSAERVRHTVDLIGQLGREFPGDYTRLASLVVLRFPYLGGTRDHPALLVSAPKP